MITTPTSIGNQTMKVKRPREGRFCVTFYFWVLFCVGSFFFLYVSIKPRKFFFFNHQKFGYYLKIKHNKRFLPQSERFYHGFGFS